MLRHPRKKLLPLSRNQQRKNLRDQRVLLLRLRHKFWYHLSPNSLPILATTHSRFSFKDTCGSEVRSLVQMIT